MIRGIALLISMLMAAACLPGMARSAAAPGSAAIAMQGVPQATPARQPAPMQPMAWSSLGPDQQRLLAPLEGQWYRLHPARQHRLAERASHWASLPPERQQQIRERLARWTHMTPAQRRQLHENARAFHNLSPAERAKVSEAFRKFQSLPPAQRKALRERWRKMSPDQRRQWATEHPNRPIPAHPPAHGGR